MSSSDTEQLLDPAYVEDAVVTGLRQTRVKKSRVAASPGKLARWVTKGGLAIL